MQNVTIAIPTYNRSSELDCLLKSLSEEFDCINVVVSDNASEDGTSDVVKWYKNHTNLSIDYIRNECNLGPDCNYFQAISRVKTEYCFLFGSDDKFEVGAKDAIKGAITKGADIAIFPRITYDSRLEVKRGCESFFYNDDLLLELKTDDDFKGYFDNCKSLGGVFSYISSILFKKDVWNDNAETRVFFGTAYSHVAALFHGLIDSLDRKIYISKDAIISCRTGNDHFASLGVLKRYQIDWDGYEALAKKYFPRVSCHLTSILGRQMTARQCLALSHSLKVTGNHEQIKFVTNRLKKSEWGNGLLLKWKLCTHVPVKLVDIVRAAS